VEGYTNPCSHRSWVSRLVRIHEILGFRSRVRPRRGLLALPPAGAQSEDRIGRRGGGTREGDSPRRCDGMRRRPGPVRQSVYPQWDAGCLPRPPHVGGQTPGGSQLQRRILARRLGRHLRRGRARVLGPGAAPRVSATLGRTWLTVGPRCHAPRTSEGLDDAGLLRVADDPSSGHGALWQVRQGGAALPPTVQHPVIGWLGRGVADAPEGPAEAALLGLRAHRPRVEGAAREAGHRYLAPPDPAVNRRFLAVRRVPVAEFEAGLTTHPRLPAAT
jgi:hypothetical protein